jgi:hypothetical protein
LSRKHQCVSSRASTAAELVDAVREGERPGILAWLESRAALWTRRKLEPNRDHAFDVLADSWYHLLGDEG